MKSKAAKIAKIVAILEEAYPEPAIPLDHDSPYTLLLAVLLSAQCTDKRVNTITPLLFEKARTPEAMAQVPVDEILAIIRPCGLGPQKAAAISALSKILVADYAGKVPDTMEALEALPGVGHKTASVVLIQAFHQVAFPVDTHIHRLAARWGLSDGSSVKRTEEDLKKAFPRSLWSKIHLQMVYFGREFCPAKKHDASLCPICSWAAV